MALILFELDLNETCDGDGEYEGTIKITRKTKEEDNLFWYEVKDVKKLMEELPSFIEEVLHNKTHDHGLRMINNLKIKKIDA